ncbi:MAG: hypothetical protein AB1426_12675 [Bacillota bacterium]
MVREGYRLYAEKKEQEGCRIWPGVGAPEKAVHFRDKVQMELSNAALFYEKRIEYCREFCSL